MWLGKLWSLLKSHSLDLRFGFKPLTTEFWDTTTHKLWIYSHSRIIFTRDTTSKGWFLEKANYVSSLLEMVSTTKTILKTDLVLCCNCVGKVSTSKFLRTKRALYLENTCYFLYIHFWRSSQDNLATWIIRKIYINSTLS